MPGKSQNLIPNPGFDDITDCPYADGQIDYATYWQSASNGTPDLFNRCSTAEWLQVPHAGHSKDSYQVPLSGSGYAYLAVFKEVQYEEGNDGNSEYIETVLTEPMLAGKEYFIEFYVSPDFNTTFHFGFTDAIGLALTNSFYYEEIDARKAMSLDPVIENREVVITDTAGWTRISGCYQAKGGERYAILGNFRSSEETLVEFEEFTFPFINFFYIDDVLIQPFDPLPDTLLLCDGGSVSLNAAFLDATFRWNTGETDSVLTISTPGLYSVEAFIGNCILHDTVEVLDTRSYADFPTDTLICQDEPLLLSSPLPGSFLWDDGSQGVNKVVTSSGDYQITVTNSCGTFVFTSHVEAEDCSCRIDVPSIFSPNEDGVNDHLELFIRCENTFQVRSFTIYDRWGSAVFRGSGSENIRWDGTWQGNAVQDGVYVWKLEYDVFKNGLPDQRVHSGDVTILR